MGIGKRIKERREYLGLTQADVAKMLGVTPSSVTNYENETSHPKEKVLYKLFEVLSCDANYLFQDEMAAPTTDPQFQHLTDNYNRMNQGGQKKLVDISDELVGNPANTAKENKNKQAV